MEPHAALGDEADAAWTMKSAVLRAAAGLCVTARVHTPLSFAALQPKGAAFHGCMVYGAW